MVETIPTPTTTDDEEDPHIISTEPQQQIPDSLNINDTHPDEVSHQRRHRLRHEGSRRLSRLSVSQPEGIDPNEGILRQSALRSESFVVQFAKTKGPPQITFIMMLVAIGIGSIIGVVPAVMTDRFASLYHGYGQDTTIDPPPSCASFTNPDDKPEACLMGSADAQTAAATANLISNVLTFVTSSMVGSISDEYGRRTILIIGCSLATTYPFMLVLIQLIPNMSPWWYYGFSAMTGIISWVAIALSALADVLPPEFRAPGIGLLLAGFLLGFSISPVLSFLLSAFQLSLLSCSVVFGGVLATIFFVPETLPPEVALRAKAKRLERESRWAEEEAEARTNGASEGWLLFKKVVILLWRPVHEMSILNRDTFFRLISLLAFFSGMVSSGDQVLLVYYLEERLSFNTQDVSLMLLVMGLTGLFCQGVLLKPLNDFVGEKMVVALCFLVGAIDNTMYGLARNKATIYAAVALSGITGMAFPTISAIKSNNVAVNEQGRIQGALYSLQALASGVGPVVLRFVYRQAKDTPLGPGAMFVFAGVLYLGAVATACALPKERANASRNRQYGSYGDDNEGLHAFSDPLLGEVDADSSGSYGSISQED